MTSPFKEEQADSDPNAPPSEEKETSAPTYERSRFEQSLAIGACVLSGSYIGSMGGMAYFTYSRYAVGTPSHTVSNPYGIKFFGNTTPEFEKTVINTLDLDPKGMREFFPENIYLSGSITEVLPGLKGTYLSPTRYDSRILPDQWGGVQIPKTDSIVMVNHYINNSLQLPTSPPDNSLSLEQFWYSLNAETAIRQMPEFSNGTPNYWDPNTDMIWETASAERAVLATNHELAHKVFEEADADPLLQCAYDLDVALLGGPEKATASGHGYYIQETRERGLSETIATAFSEIRAGKQLDAFPHSSAVVGNYVDNINRMEYRQALRSGDFTGLERYVHPGSKDYQLLKEAAAQANVKVVDDEDYWRSTFETEIDPNEIVACHMNYETAFGDVWLDIEGNHMRLHNDDFSITSERGKAMIISCQEDGVLLVQAEQRLSVQHEKNLDIIDITPAFNDRVVMVNWERSYNRDEIDQYILEHAGDASFFSKADLAALNSSAAGPEINSTLTHATDVNATPLLGQGGHHALLPIGDSHSLFAGAAESLSALSDHAFGAIQQMNGQSALSSCLKIAFFVTSMAIVTARCKENFMGGNTQYLLSKMPYRLQNAVRQAGDAAGNLVASAARPFVKQKPSATAWGNA